MAASSSPLPGDNHPDLSHDDDDAHLDHDHDDPDIASHGGSSLTDPKQLQKRRRVTRACDECRRKKIKCDGKQPCTHCTVYSYGMFTVDSSITADCLTITRMYIRSAFESPAESCPSVRGSPRESSTQGRGPHPSRHARSQPRRPSVRSACDRADAGGC